MLVFSFLPLGSSVNMISFVVLALANLGQRSNFLNRLKIKTI